jgi:hypothetical protein
MLAKWQHHYNWHRPHAGIGGVPPMSRLKSASGNNVLTLHSWRTRPRAPGGAARAGHRGIVKETLGAAVTRYTADKGLGGVAPGAPGAPAAVVASCALFVESLDAFQAGMAAKGEAIMADVPDCRLHDHRAADRDHRGGRRLTPDDGDVSAETSPSSRCARFVRGIIRCSSASGTTGPCSGSIRSTASSSRSTFCARFTRLSFGFGGGALRGRRRGTGPRARPPSASRNAVAVIMPDSTDDTDAAPDRLRTVQGERAGAAGRMDMTSARRLLVTMRPRKRGRAAAWFASERSGESRAGPRGAACRSRGGVGPRPQRPRGTASIQRRAEGRAHCRAV